MKFDINNVICIKLKSLDTTQLFSVSIEYDLLFDLLIEYKEKRDCLWLELKNNIYYSIAVSSNDEIKFLYNNDNEYYGGLTKNELDKFKSIKPVKTPKIKINEKSITKYKELLNKGYNLKVEKLDRSINAKEEIGMDVNDILDKINVSGIESISKSSISKLETKETIKKVEENVTNKIKIDVTYYDVDTILDKIGLYGIGSITEKEKIILDNGY